MLMSEPIITAPLSTPTLISGGCVEISPATEGVIVETNVKPASMAVKNADFFFHAGPIGSEATERLKVVHLQGFIINCRSYMT